MLGPDTMVLTVQNGLPWWYFQKLGGKYDNQQLESLDPTGVLTSKIDASRIVGCVVYPAAAVTAPGVIHHVEGDRFPIGELDGKETRARQANPRRAGQGRSQIARAQGHPLGDLAQGVGQSVLQPDQRAHPRDAGRYLPVRRDAPSRRADDGGGARPSPRSSASPSASPSTSASPAPKASARTRPSMLQDVEAGRSLETEALIGSILEMAQAHRARRRRRSNRSTRWSSCSTR